MNRGCVVKLLLACLGLFVLASACVDSPEERATKECKAAIDQAWDTDFRAGDWRTACDPVATIPPRARSPKSCDAAGENVDNLLAIVSERLSPYYRGPANIDDLVSQTWERETLLASLDYLERHDCEY